MYGIVAYSLDCDVSLWRLSGKDRHHTRDRKPDGVLIIGFGKLCSNLLI